MGWGGEGRVVEEEHGRITNIKDSLKATCEPTTIEVFQIHTHTKRVQISNNEDQHPHYIYNWLPNKIPKRKGLPLRELLAFTVPSISKLCRLLP